MKMVSEVINAIAIVSLFLAGVGMIAYYVIEFISSFFISTLNMVEIGGVLWKIIFICFGGSACSFALAYFIGKKNQ